uniref:LRRNT domain-containing protein n=1 Tax=Oncorhynchus tshawytscha TaxID=74940 RepID=A0AAZ3R6T2_ONCTS
ELGRDLGRGLGGWSFTLLVLLLLLSPVFPQCPDSCHCVWESSMVLCTDAGLREFPQGLPPDTVTLHLERNYIHNNWDFLNSPSLLLLVHLIHLFID